MSLNPAMVYRRTDRGLREVYEKSHQFTQSERLVLILLDGRLSVAALHERLPSLDNERIERTLVKLEEAGLLEPAGSGELPSASPAEEVMRLQPDIVAEFLEQSDLDPITTSALQEQVAAGALVRARAERGESDRMTESVGELDVVSSSPSSGAGPAESGRSRTSDPRAFNDFGWEMPESTSFAITTVNVPDRLDMQHERDRVDMEDFVEDRRRAFLELWMKRLLVAAVVLVVVGVLHGVVRPLWEETSAERVGQRLTAAFDRPVRVADTEFRFLPSPRLLLHGIDVAGEFGADRVTLLINWSDLWLALNGGPWAWGQATVAPLELTPAQAVAAIRTLSGPAATLPRSISAIRFESVRVRDSRLFQGEFVATLRRGERGAFGPLVVEQATADDGSLQMRFRPSATEAGVTDFVFEARRWAAPLGPRVRWNDVRASGRLRERLLEVSDYMLGGYYGITTGALYVAGDVEWVATGFAEAGNIDVESVFQSLDGKARGGPAPLQGTAALKLLVVGRGSTAEEAVSGSALTGGFDVRFAVLNGINLGLAATQGVSASGATRFTEFGGTVQASGSGVRFEETGGRAGAMVARANFTVAPDRSLAGGVQVDFEGRQIQAPLRVELAGTAMRPRFGR